MRLLYGAVQRKGTLDYLIERLADRPAERLDARLLAALRLGLYELLYLRGAPDHAVVADGVELAKGGARGGHGLVNAVLRRGAREGAGAAGGAERRDAGAGRGQALPSGVDRATVVGGAGGERRPRADGLRQRARRGGAAREHAAHRRRDARRRAAGGHRMPTRTCPRRWCSRARSTRTTRPHGARERSWRSRARRCASSRVLDPQPGERVLDLCAAPGGKSTHLAALMGRRGRGRRGRAQRAAGRACSRAPRSGCTPPTSASRSPTPRAERPEGAVFDRVLVDPPCSGLGTLQARADLRWRVTPEDVREMTRPGPILAAGAAAVRPGGVLVYSTCTISPTENEHPDRRFPRCPPRLQPR